MFGLPRLLRCWLQGQPPSQEVNSGLDKDESNRALYKTGVEGYEAEQDKSGSCVESLHQGHAATAGSVGRRCLQRGRRDVDGYVGPIEVYEEIKKTPLSKNLGSRTSGMVRCCGA